jgi:hypothetical protein
VVSRGPASPLGEGGGRRLGEPETSPNTAHNTETQAPVAQAPRPPSGAVAETKPNARAHGYGAPAVARNA